MNDAVWKRDEIDSPCLKVCVMHPEATVCIGCRRTIEEIAGWSQMSAEARAAILLELPTRAKPATKRRGGRAARMQRSG